MAWTADDLARSIRRYLNPVLNDDPPTWAIRAEVQEIGVEDRPVAVVEIGPTSIVRARTSRHQGEVEALYPVTISAYPAVADDERLGRHEADALRELLERLISVGYPVEAGGRLWSGPFRLPLWDYSGVDVEGSGRAATPPVPNDVVFVDVASLAVEPIRDPDDYRRFSVIANFRAHVERPGREPEPGPIATSLTGRFAPP